jgi:ribosomal protein S18 acetylase RimI-like enzyme
VRIREATISDSAALARIQVDSYRTAYAGLFPQAYLDRFTYEEQEQDWCDLLSSETADILYVAEAGPGEIVGYALGRPGPGGVSPYESELVALHVHSSHQGQGVGRRLVAAMARHLQERGVGSLMLWVLEQNRSRLFYERLGGQLLDERQTIEGGAVEVAYGWPAIERLAEEAVDWLPVN